MIILYANEEFREVEIDSRLTLRYAISNYGRLVSFTNDIKDGTLLNGSIIDGYRIFRYKVRIDDAIKHKHYFFYKLVAQAFLPMTNEEESYVIHLDYVRDNDNVNNLKRVSYKDRLEHAKKSPHVIEAKRKLAEFNTQADGRKLTSTQVMRLKKLLNDPKRKNRLKIIAKQFGVSETQIKRIKSGENWGHIKV